MFQRVLVMWDASELAERAGHGARLRQQVRGRDAHEHCFDLIVVGHHHHAKPGVLVTHGVTEQLISEAELPVLVVGG